MLLTHQHIDHVGLARTVKDRSGAEIAAGASLADYLADLDASMEADDRFASAVMELHGVPEAEIAALRELVRAFRAFATSVAVDRPLAEGQRVELSGRAFETLARPGHSPTDTIFVDHEARMALVGDHLLSEISSNPVLHRQPLEDADPRRRTPALARYLESLERTADLELEELLPGHGPAFGDHRSLIAERVELHRLRKEQMYGVVAASPRTAHELARAVWGDIALQQVFLTLSEALGHLDLLVAEGRVREVEGDRRIVFEAT